uniref:Malate dehydrogenase n=1 Tax=Acrobeloides nanus TaxID=290746 RepID=A0A914EBK7_9BILA
MTPPVQQVNTESQYLVPVDEMKKFMVDALKTAGVTQDHASQQAELLMSADSRGHYSHGLNRLHIYVNDVKSGMNAKEGSPKILKQKGSTAWVDGENLLGAVVGNFCMDLAIKLAKEHGVGWVTAKQSNHFGIAGHYSLRAAAHGLVGISMTNASPLVFPTRSSEIGLGTNPIAFVASAQNGDNFALDMANSTVALGKVELATRKGKTEVPPGWGADQHGTPTTDAKKILNDGGYKGTGLSMMVETLCGVMSGAGFGQNIRRWNSVSELANLGQCFIAVDPECFAPGFPARLQQFIDETRNLKPANPSKPVLVAGDPERNHLAKGQKLGGLMYHGSQIEYINKIAKELKVVPCSFKEIVE